MNIEAADKIYPNTKTGVLLYLRDETDINISDDNSSVEAEPDYCDNGVWKVKLNPDLNDDCDTVVVYLAGYEDSFGNKSSYNDHEIGSSSCM